MKLTDTQLVLLSRAAKRDDRVLPSAAKSKDPTSENAMRSLLRAGFFEEIAAEGSLPVWRRDETFGARSLRITPQGLQAIGVDGETQSQAGHERKRSTKAPAAKIAAKSVQSSGKAAKPSSVQATRGSQRASESKQAMVLRLLHRRAGASLGAIVQQTGWQPHSVRGFLAGVVRKKLKLRLVSEKIADKRIYRIEDRQRAKASGRRTVQAKAA